MEVLPEQSGWASEMEPISSEPLASVYIQVLSSQLQKPPSGETWGFPSLCTLSPYYLCTFFYYWGTSNRKYGEEANLLWFSMPLCALFVCSVHRSEWHTSNTLHQNDLDHRCDGLQFDFVPCCTNAHMCLVNAGRRGRDM